MRDIAITRIMTTDPATVSPDDTVAHARKLIAPDRLHHLPVTEHGKLVGIVSSSDLLKLFLLDANSADVARTPVRAIMAVDPVTLDSSASLRHAANKLSVGTFHALPVIEPDKTLVGIVTSSDLIEHLLRQIPTGDGTLQERALPASSTSVSDADFTATMTLAEEAVRQGKDNAAARTLVHLDERNRLMKAVCKAAELYIRSGLAEHEHSVLVKKLAELRGAADPVAL